jgi:hypothetical protein
VAKMRLPGNKFIDGANTAEKLYILIAHDVEHLRPHQYAYQHDNYQHTQRIFSLQLHSSNQHLMPINYHALPKPSVNCIGIQSF